LILSEIDSPEARRELDNARRAILAASRSRRVVPTDRLPLSLISTVRRR